ncbi:DNA cytosine methyltransferase [Castellaniella hirudinis]|uniref:DNA cytosine methyltransferase n=1 Tax=Castellaniella hirudinis TaxID=1144617 RepID=UPI0039C3CA6E
MIESIKHFHLFCGSGSGAAGFNDAAPTIPGLQGKMVCLGGMDNDAVAAEDFRMLTGMPCMVRDLFSRQQYVAWHGHEPSADWVEAGPDDIRAAAQHQVPDIVFLSAPCKGFSGLLPAAHASSRRYQALNELTLRGVWLMLEAWAYDPVPVILFENVPRIATRGRHLLDQITGMLRHYGYVVRETTHDCGELGGLAQSRKRFLLVARHAEKMPSAVYEPPVRPLRSVGEVLDRMHLPGDPTAGPMHRVPRLAWKTWVRLAFVEAGKDWRSLNRLTVEDGYLRDYLIVPKAYHGYLGVLRPGDTSGAVTSRGLPTNGAFSIADPRAAINAAQYKQYGVMRMEDTSGAVIGVKSPGQGTFSVADPRHSGPEKHSNEYRIVPFDQASGAITSAHGTGQCVADPRGGHGFAKYGVTSYESSANAVISGSTSGQGAYAVADPRSSMRRTKGDDYLTGGHYGIVNWAQPSGAVSASACHDNGRWSVADPRNLPNSANSQVSLPAPNDKLVCRIRSLDGTWHRPFTTLELAALQSYYDPDDFAEHGPLVMEGTSDQVWREHIGNMVPPDAAQAMAEEIGRAILLSRAGETFQLSATPIWVRPLAIAIAVRGGIEA